jgi:hypothetical protein
MPTVDCRSTSIVLRGLPDRTGQPERFGYARRGARSRVMVAAIIVSASGGPGAGRVMAQESEFHASLRYRIDSSLNRCWDEPQFRRRVAGQLGYDPFREDALATVEVEVGGSAKAIGGQVEWKNADGARMGERRFAAKDGNCAKLLAEMSFAVSLQIALLRQSTSTAESNKTDAAASGDAVAQVATAAQPPSSAPSPPPSGESSSATSHPTALPEPDPGGSGGDRDSRAETRTEAETPTSVGAGKWSMWTGLGPSGAWGIAPSLTGSGRLFLGIRRNDLSLELGAETSFPSNTRQWGGGGFRAMLIGGSAGLCGHLGVLAGCLVGKAGQLRINGLGLDEPGAPRGFVAQAGLRIAATAKLGRWWMVSAHLDGLGLITPCAVEINGIEVWTMPWVSVLAGIDLSVRFW